MNRRERLTYLVDYMLREREEKLDKYGVAEEEKLASLFRALMNIRAPKPISQEYLRIQDEELQWQLQRKGIVTMEEVGTKHSSLAPTIWQGDITCLQMDAIVNAANSQMLGCFHPLHDCIDNAIHSAAGVQLRLECARMGTADLENGKAYEIGKLRLPTGQARMTKGYNLPARYVIHTVGPIIPDGIPTKEQCMELTSCYINSLRLADENGLQSVALCCISTGEFCFPNQMAADIAVETVKDFLSQAKSVRRVVFNVFKDEDYKIYMRLLGESL